MTPDQQALARNTLQQVVDIATARALWSIHPLLAAALGAAAFALLWWLAA